MDKYAIIVAGGTGSRLNSKTPKQFVLLAGIPVLMHSINAFHRYDPNVKILVSLHPDYTREWEQLCEKFNFQIQHTVVGGGETRFHSVRNALTTITVDGLVAVHDAARPLVSQQLIAHTFEQAGKYKSAVPAIAVNETVRSTEGNYVKLIDRSSLRIIQTPQVFDIRLLQTAYRQEYVIGFTDDASLVEAMGMQVHLVQGSTRNIKITLPGDLEVAELYYRQELK
ncbi:MAG: 2-C-methyl-D-erythritol 4-phosphate cytidylyltransferase [Bacteroidetes bacterium]|nr:2-C-methyl-D-erythritol 4-phosphate cytidylyltransferase [Bacteroidota bacterium]